MSTPYFKVISECRPDIVHKDAEHGTAIHGSLHLFPGDIIQLSATDPKVCYLTVLVHNEQLPWWIKYALKAKKIEAASEGLPTQNARVCERCSNPEIKP